MTLQANGVPAVLPALATFGIGSLPHTDGDAALACAFCLDIPTLPQLPMRDPQEFMLAAALRGFPGARSDGGGMVFVSPERKAKEEHTAGRLAPSHALTDDFFAQASARQAHFVKLQFAGPCTLQWLVSLEDGQGLWEDAPLAQAAVEFVRDRAVEGTLRARASGAVPLVFFDEPGLYALDPHEPSHRARLAALALVVGDVQKVGAMVGLHCCADTAWKALMETGADVIAFDARLSLSQVLSEPATFEFLTRGGRLAVGIVPTDAGPDFSSRRAAKEALDVIHAQVPGHVSLKALLSSLCLTPACGLAMQRVDDAERVLAYVREVQVYFREHLAQL